MSAEKILQHHLECFGAGDLEGLLSDYSPDIVLFTQDGVIEGIAGLRPLFDGMFAEFGQPGVTFELHASHTRGDWAYITWSAETPENTYGLGTDTLVVRDGKIVMQTFAAHVTPRG